MNNPEENSENLLEKYNKLTKKEQQDFWANLLLLLILGKNKTNTEEDGE